MIIECIVIALLAKAKGLRLTYLFRTWTFYPILLAQCVLVGLQVSIFLRYYGFVSWATNVEMAVILSFLFALVAFDLHRPAILGAISIAFGTLLNRWVITANGGKMPVYPTLSYLTGYVTPQMLHAVDSIHVAGGENTKLWWLSDYIDLGYSILSPGDVLIHLYACLMFYALIKAVNTRYGQQNNQIATGGTHL